MIRFNLFIVHPGPVGLDGNDTAVTNRQLCCATDQNRTRLARELAECIVCVSDPQLELSRLTMISPCASSRLRARSSASRTSQMRSESSSIRSSSMRCLFFGCAIVCR